jgi:hypothetical protein
MYGKKRPDLVELNKSRKGEKLTPETIEKMKRAGSNRMWITDEKEETLIKKDSRIPAGWRKGRKPGWNKGGEIPK